MNLKEIVNSWMISFNPTKEQVILAINRGKICESCPLTQSRLGVTICGGCGCPISKKIFSPIFNTCPEKLWHDIDTEYFKDK